MGKLITAMFYLFIIYLILQFVMLYFRGGHEQFYTIESGENRFFVKEEYVVDGKQSHYFFTVDVNEEETFYFQTYESFHRVDNVIDDIIYLDANSAQCILPIFVLTEINSDVICHYQGMVYDYQKISKRVAGLDKEIEQLKQNYDLASFQDNSDFFTREYVTVHSDNVLNNHYFYMTNYRGIGTISMDNLNRYAKIEFFRNDVYEMSLKILIDNNLLMANYNQRNEFNQFKAINLITNNVEDIILDRYVSFDSYFQGVAVDMVYLYDRENKRQYQINIATGGMIEVGNEEIGVKILIDDEWEWLETTELANEDIYFQEKEDIDFEIPAKYVDYEIVMGELGYIYYFAEDTDKYQVYRAPMRQPKYKKHLFSTTDIDSIKLIYDYVYYRDGEKVKYYNDATGVKTLVENSEFAFNETLDFGIFIRR